jgi:mannosyltransferase
LRVRDAPILIGALLGFAARLAFLPSQSLWYDEAFSLAVARADWPVFWAALLSDGVHPPGYYLLLRASLVLLGSSELALRFPSALAGTLAIALIYQLGRSLGNRRWGLVAALLLALNPFALWYAQEARMYSFLLCLTVAGAYAFWRLVARPTPRHWLWLAFISALSFSLHYFAFMFSLAQFVYLVVRLRQTHRVLRWWVTAQAAAFLPFTPWAVAVATREGRNFGIGWIHPPTLLDLPLTLSNLALALSNPNWPLTWAALALVGVTLVVGVVTQTKHLTLHAPRSTRYTLFPASYTFLLVWLLVPIAFTWLISLWLPLYVDRFFIICLPSLLLLISTISLSSAWLARGTMTVLIMASILASVRLWVDPNLAKEDWRAAAAYIQSMEKPGDTLVMRDFQTGIPFGYYYQGALRPQIASINQQTTPLDALVHGYDRLWIVYRRPFEPVHSLAGSQPFTWRDDHNPVIRDWLASHAAVLVQEVTFPGVYIVLYQLSPDG